MKHTLSVLVEDEAGVLTRIAGLFARRASILKVLRLAQPSRLAFPDYHGGAWRRTHYRAAN
jgi:hypothetical protein